MDAATLYKGSEQKKRRKNVGEDYNFHLECSFLVQGASSWIYQHVA